MYSTPPSYHYIGRLWNTAPMFYSSNVSQPPSELIRIEEEYKIDKIINHWGTATRRQYLIRWKGYSDAEQTWKLESNLGNALAVLKEYKNQWGL